MLDLKAIQERAEKATPKPWIVPLDEPHIDAGGIVHYVLEDASGHQLMLLQRLPEVSSAEHEANAEFIAHAREDIPMLLKALAEARGKLEAARDWRKAVERHRHTLVAVEWATLDAILGGCE